MARVLSVITPSIRFGSMLRVSRSISTKTGVKPAWSTALPVATKDSAGTTTSSPRLAPKSYSTASARASASVPVLTATASFVPVSSANFFSNSLTSLPLERRLASSASMISSFALGVTESVPNGILILSVPPIVHISSCY